MKLIKIISFLAFVFIASCSQYEHKNDANASFEPILFSKAFGIAKFEHYQQVFYTNNGDTIYSIKSDSNSTKSPKIVVLSTVFAGFLEALYLQNLIVGVDKISYYSDSILWSNFENKSLIEVGEEAQLNIEKLMLLKPDFIICTSTTAKDNAISKRLNASGIQLIACDNFKENHPLARAEWIKLFGFLCNRFTQSDSLFNVIVNNYKQLSVSVSDTLNKPLVLTDALYNDVWNVPGANSYTAQLIHDAGGNYVFNDKKSNYTHPLSLEIVFRKAKNADVWIHVNQFNGLNEMILSEKRYSLFKAFKEGNVFNYNKQINAFGGNNFWEMGVVRPDWVLADLKEIVNNYKNKTSNLFFYKRLD